MIGRKYIKMRLPKLVLSNMAPSMAPIIPGYQQDLEQFFIDITETCNDYNRMHHWQTFRQYVYFR